MERPSVLDMRGGIACEEQGRNPFGWDDMSCTTGEDDTDLETDDCSRLSCELLEDCREKDFLERQGDRGEGSFAKSKAAALCRINAEREKMAQILRAVMLARHIEADSHPCRVDEGVYVGSVGAANNRATLLALRVTHIITVANAMEPMFPQDFKYTVVDVLDASFVDLGSRFEECFAAIDEAKRAGGAALVHCFAGRSRSVTVVVAYLMKTHRMGLDAALAHVRRCRPQAQPNDGFLLQLQALERRLKLHGALPPPPLLYSLSEASSDGGSSSSDSSSEAEFASVAVQCLVEGR